MKKRKVRPQAWIALIVVVVLFIAAAFFIILNKKPALSIEFKETKTTIEYGTTDVKAESLVASFNADEVIYPEIDTSKVGPQKIEFVLKSKDKEKKVEYTVEIKDTQNPQITMRQEVAEISVGQSYDFAANVESASDAIDGALPYKADPSKDEVNYYTASSNADLTKAGEYTVNVEAVDQNGNHAAATYTLKVVENDQITNSSNGDIEPTYINGILIVNKKYGIPADFGGWNEEASTALETLQAGANAAGYDIPLVSGWRSYDYQVGLYNNYVQTDGQEAADRYSARPGFSEHQTGLCFDIGAVDDNYGTTPEGKWLAAHAHEYGFIIRYPEGKEAITGYMYEPWHVRYVGIEAATEIYNSQTTLEEYLGVSG